MIEEYSGNHYNKEYIEKNYLINNKVFCLEDIKEYIVTDDHNLV